MRTAETQAVFDRDIIACRAQEGRSAEFIAASLARTNDRHTEYDRQFDECLSQIRAIPHAAVRDYVCQLLIRLGRAGCLSGSGAFCDALDYLRGHGVTHANHIMEHDRAVIARIIGEGKGQ